jgi:hypothetical protein
MPSNDLPCDDDADADVELARRPGAGIVPGRLPGNGEGLRDIVPGRRPRTCLRIPFLSELSRC